MNDDLSMMHRLFNALYKANRLVKKRLRYYALNDLETFILINIGFMDEEVTQKNLCNKFKAPKTTINNSIMNLKEKEYIKLVPSKIDKRKKILILTSKGKEHRRKILKPINESNQRIFEDIGKENIDQIIQSLTILTDAIINDHAYMEYKKEEN